jgi:hypothetical protein
MRAAARARDQVDPGGMHRNEVPGGRVERYSGLVITPHARRVGSAVEALLATA